MRTSPCLFHLVSLDAVVLFAAHWQGLHGPFGPFGPSWPIWPIRSWRNICCPALHSSGPAWSTDFGCISGDAEWKTAHLLVPLASQLSSSILVLNPRRSPRLPCTPRASLSFAFDSVDLWSVRFSCVALLCCALLCPVLRSDIIGGTSNLLSIHARAHTHTHLIC